MGALLHCSWECKLLQLLWKTMWRFLKKLKIDDPAIALLGIYPRGTGMLMHRGTFTPNVYGSVLTIAKLCKDPKCPPTDEWIMKMWFIYTMEYYLAMRKNETVPFAATWMELEGFMLSEISQSEKQISYVFTHVDLKKLKRRPWGRGRGKIVTNREGGRETIRDS